MKKLILPILALVVANMYAQGLPIFDSSMTVTGYGTIDSPFGEEVDKITDGDINTKFLDFVLGDGMGFIVDLGGASTAAHYIELTTANDFPVRDPIDYTIEGSIDGTNFSIIDTGTVVCISERFESRLFSITNPTAYSHYRIDFSAPCDPSGGTGIPSIQLAEVQLYEMELGIGENLLTRDDFSISPNPNNGLFNLNYSGDNQIDEIHIVNLAGQVLKTSTVNDLIKNMEINISTEAPGLYFIQVKSGSSAVTKKIIIR